MNVHQIAAWDTAALGTGCRQLSVTADQPSDWVRRCWEVQGALAAPEVWDGAAAAAAAADLAAWQAVVARLDPPWCELSTAVDRAAHHYSEAQDVAATALATAAAHGLTVDSDGRVWPGAQVDTAGMEPGQATAATARAGVSAQVQGQLDRAMALARDGDRLVGAAADDMARQGVAAGGGWGDLLVAMAIPVGAPVLPRVPVRADPRAVAAWWASLPYDVQLALIRERPDLIGNLDGIPPVARDEANRILLAELLAAGPGRSPGERAAYAFAVAVDEALRTGAGSGPPRQLYLFDVEHERAAISVGLLDTAADVAVLVPGTGTTVVGSMSGEVVRAGRIWDSATAVPGAGDVAVLAWVGYDAPSLIEAPFDDRALEGGPLLASALTGLSVRPGPPPSTTVIAHSYGTVTTQVAAEEPGDLEVDSVVLVGSPGTLSWDADFDIPDEQVFVGEAWADPVADSHWFGVDPSWSFYGASCIDAGAPGLIDGHSSYFDPGSEALAGMGVVIRGRYDLVGCTNRFGPDWMYGGD